MNTIIAWRGPSLLNGAPARLLIVYKSRNEKTRNVAQAYVLRDDMEPRTAIARHETGAICGACPWQQRGCYAERSKGLISIGARMRRDGYSEAPLDAAADALRGRVLRLGAYGDPAAVPLSVWETLCAGAESWTGYTHQWRSCDPALSRYCMASVESVTDAEAARALGWRTFRVRRVDFRGVAEPVLPGEIVCPASRERPLTSCEACRLCSGTAHRSRRNVAIIEHSTAALALRRKYAQQ